MLRDHDRNIENKKVENKKEIKSLTREKLVQLMIDLYQD